jgi:Ca2+:H+ antiporter
VYILYLIFQLKSHSYLYQSMPQERIDEESHPGLLADVFDSSSSSDTSSSSSSDTDTTSGSHTTVKRIKRAFRNRRRRKSTTNSEDTRSVPSALPSPPPELNSPGSDGPYYKDRNGSFLGAITSGNEADHEGQTRNLSFVTKIRDFETSAEPSTMSPDRSSSPEGKYRRRMRKQRKHQKKHKKAAEKIKSLDKGIAEDAVEDAEPALRVDFAEPSTIPPGTSGSGTSKGKTGTHWRPGLPKLLSQNVFVDKPPVQQQQQPHPRLNRASSLPDLSRVSTVPGRGLRPSQLPPQPPPSKPKQILSSGEESEDEEEREAPQLSRTAAVVMLFVSTGLVALCAEFLVDAIPGMTESSNVSQTFIGLIILPIVGNAAEHVTAVTVAMKNKMDLSIGVAVGSSIQIGKFSILNTGFF